jgi:predicted DNA-binding transcriptional regulator AlpA
MQIVQKPRRSRATYAPVTAELTPDARIKLAQIIGDSGATPPVPGLLPVGKTTIYKLVKEGRFPAPVKVLGGRASYWRYGDVLDAVARLEAQTQGASYATPLQRKRAAGSAK